MGERTPNTFALSSGPDSPIFTSERGRGRYNSCRMGRSGVYPIKDSSAPPLIRQARAMKTVTAWRRLQGTWDVGRRCFYPSQPFFWVWGNPVTQEQLVPRMERLTRCWTTWGCRLSKPFFLYIGHLTAIPVESQTRRIAYRPTVSSPRQYPCFCSLLSSLNFSQLVVQPVYSYCCCNFREKDDKEIRQCYLRSSLPNRDMARSLRNLPGLSPSNPPCPMPPPELYRNTIHPNYQSQS